MQSVHKAVQEVPQLESSARKAIVDIQDFPLKVGVKSDMKIPRPSVVAPYKYSNRRVGQIVLIQIRCHRMRRLIRIYTVCNSRQQLLDYSTGGQMDLFKF